MTVSVRVRCPGADPEQIEAMARGLRAEVLDTDVHDARLAVDGSASARAKSGELLAVGALVVTLAPTVAESLMTVVASWLSRQPDDVEIEVDGHRFRGRVTRTQRDELVAAYLRRIDRDSRLGAGRSGGSGPAQPGEAGLAQPGGVGARVVEQFPGEAPPGG
jgi:hypothetical protein